MHLERPAAYSAIGAAGASLWYRWRPTEKLYRAELPARARGAPRAACATALQAQPVCQRQKRVRRTLWTSLAHGCRHPGAFPSHEEAEAWLAKPAVPPRKHPVYAVKEPPLRLGSVAVVHNSFGARQTQPSKRLEVAALDAEGDS